MKKILILSVMAVALLTACEKPVVIEPNGNNNKTDIKYTELNLKNLVELLGETKDSTMLKLANFTVTENQNYFTSLIIKTEDKEYVTMYDKNDCRVILVLDSIDRVYQITLRSEKLQRTFVDTEINTIWAGHITDTTKFDSQINRYIIDNKIALFNTYSSYNDVTKQEIGCFFGCNKYGQ